jgi:hypothetical protein
MTQLMNSTRPAGNSVELAVRGDAQLVSNEDLPSRVRFDLTKLEASIADYPEEVKEDVLWLASFRHTEFSDHTALLFEKITQLGIKTSEQYLYQLLAGKYFRRHKVTGKHQGSAETVKEIVAACRQWAFVNAESGGLPFVEHGEWRDLCNYLDGIRNPENVIRFGAVVGHTGRGKSRMLKRYALLHNHGKTVHLEASRTASLARFQAKLGFCYGVPFNAKTTDRLERITQNVRHDRMIIIDNVQKFYRPHEGGNQPLFDYIQELQDETRCTVILSWTPGFTRTMTDGTAVERAYFEQFIGRLGGLDRVHELPDYMPTASLRTIAEKFDLGGGDEGIRLLKKWSRQPGRDRILFARLQEALLLAKDEGARRAKLEHLRAADLQDVPTTGEEGEE